MCLDCGCARFDLDTDTLGLVWSCFVLDGQRQSRQAKRVKHWSVLAHSCGLVGQLGKRSKQSERSLSGLSVLFGFRFGLGTLGTGNTILSVILPFLFVRVVRGW